MSQSPSPSDWIKKVQASQSQHFGNHTLNSDDDDDENEFHFNKHPTNEYQEIIDENEESEMESEYVETEVSEEEIIEHRVPIETEIELDESESCSDYTSIASVSPGINASNSNHNVHNHFRNQAKRRQSMPSFNQQPKTNNGSQINELSPMLNDENRPPSTPLRLQTVNEEQKEKEKINNGSVGSIDRSEIFNQSILQANTVKKAKKSILPIQALQFDDEFCTEDQFESPAPPSCL